MIFGPQTLHRLPELLDGIAGPARDIGIRCLLFYSLPQLAYGCKYIADRFFPIRKTPCSAKDLFNDHLEWMEDE